MGLSHWTAHYKIKCVRCGLYAPNRRYASKFITNFHCMSCRRKLGKIANDVKGCPTRCRNYSIRCHNCTDFNRYTEV